MFRTSMFTSALLALALGMMATASAVTPVSAFSSQVYGARNQQVFAHFHPRTTIGLSRYRFPGKKKN
jgi:hypothetical protein